MYINVAVNAVTHKHFIMSMTGMLDRSHFDDCFLRAFFKRGS